MNQLVDSLSEVDLFLISRYQDFLPSKVFDAHMHLPFNPSIPSLAGTSVFFREAYTPDDYIEEVGRFLPGVEIIRLNMMPTPSDRTLGIRKNGQRDKANNYLFQVYEKFPEHVVTPLILPSDSEADIYQLASHRGCRGFKCYAYTSGVEDLEKAAIEQYLPESAWVVAHEKRLPIVLHLFREGALSDPDNFRYIMTMTHRYPNAQLILAHCARGFAAWTVMESIKRLEDRGNIWFDLSAICESSTMAACIIKNAGKRTLWGSDYPSSMCRGRAVSVGKWQNWLSYDSYKGAERALLPVENLLAFYHTALLLELDQTQIEDIFYNNAEGLFGK